MPDISLLDKLEAGLVNRDQFLAEILNQVYSGLHQYCDIPDGYRHCTLATRLIDLGGLDEADLREILRHPPAEVVNPHASHIKAITLFHLLLSGDSLACDHGDPLTPTMGAYLYGPPGSGKTHVMAAYGRRIKERLDEKLKDVHKLMGQVIDDAYRRYSERVATEPEATDEAIGYLKLSKEGISTELAATDEFWQTIEQFKQRLSEYEYQPTDLIYIGFKELYEVCKYSSERHDAMRALEMARVVFIDDIHPQGDPEQVQLVLHLLERRYELGRAGTFLTTNLAARELGGGDEMLGSRLMSRCAETLMMIDFSDCEDWRQTVKSRRIKMVEDEVDRRAQSHRHQQELPEAEDG